MGSLWFPILTPWLVVAKERCQESDVVGKEIGDTQKKKDLKIRRSPVRDKGSKSRIQKTDGVGGTDRDLEVTEERVGFLDTE